MAVGSRYTIVLYCVKWSRVKALDLNHHSRLNSQLQKLPVYLFWRLATRGADAFTWHFGGLLKGVENTCDDCFGTVAGDGGQAQF